MTTGIGLDDRLDGDKEELRGSEEIEVIQEENEMEKSLDLGKQIDQSETMKQSDDLEHGILYVEAKYCTACNLE